MAMTTSSNQPDVTTSVPYPKIRRYIFSDFNISFCQKFEISTIRLLTNKTLSSRRINLTCTRTCTLPGLKSTQGTARISKIWAIVKRSNRKRRSHGSINSSTIWALHHLDNIRSSLLLHHPGGDVPVLKGHYSRIDAIQRLVKNGVPRHWSDNHTILRHDTAGKSC